MEHTWNENEKMDFAKMANGLYLPQVEKSVYERVNTSISRNEAIKVLSELEQMCFAIRTGGGTDQRVKHIQGMTETNTQPYRYNGSRYLDVFDAIYDFGEQTDTSVRKLAEILRMSFRGIALINNGPPYRMTVKREIQFDRLHDQYVNRLAQYAQLAQEEAAHLHSLPTVHSKHMRWEEKKTQEKTREPQRLL